MIFAQHKKVMNRLSGQSYKCSMIAIMTGKTIPSVVEYLLIGPKIRKLSWSIVEGL